MVTDHYYATESPHGGEIILLVLVIVIIIIAFVFWKTFKKNNSN